MTSNEKQPWWEEKFIRAVTLYPWATMDIEETLSDFAHNHVNTVMVICKESDGRVFYDSDIAPQQVPERDLLAEIVETGHKYNLSIVPVFITLLDKYLLEENPQFVQVAQDGTKIEYPNVSFEWMHAVCPTHDEVKQHLSGLTQEISEYDVDGIRFQHIEYQSIRNNNTNHLSCFCDRCLEEMADNNTIDANNEEWLKHRTHMTSELLQSLSEPFDDDQMVNLQFEVFNDADSTLRYSRHDMGLDIEQTTTYIDTLTPRTAHIDIGVHPNWIRDVTRSLKSEVDMPIIPSIRTASSSDPDNKLSIDNIHTAIQMALNGGANGVSLFSAGANVGRLTKEQWDVVETTFKQLSHQYD